MDVTEVGARGVPARPFEPVVRSRLIERMRVACAYRVALVSAPAGFGKSVAIKQYLESAEVAHARFALRKEHATLLGFVRGFAECIEPFAPMAIKSVPGAYERATQTPNAVRELAIWLAALLREAEGTIVIDDLHIAGQEQAAELIAEIIDRTSPGLRWIIATRDISPLPVASWFAQNVCGMPIDERDLELTFEEANEAATSAGTGLSTETVRELQALTKSWPAAFAFALAISTKTTNFASIAMMARQTIYQYLAQQVFADLLPADKQFLMRTCLFPTLEPEILAKGGMGETHDTLERLARLTAFTTKESAGEYKYHDLFREFLEHQVRRDGENAYGDCVRGTGQALESAGRPESALAVYIAGENTTAVSALLLHRGQTLLDHGFIELVDRGLSLVWAEVAKMDPRLISLRADVMSKMVRVNESVSLYRQALTRSTGDLYADIAQRFIRLLLNNLQLDEAQVIAETIAFESIESLGIRANVMAVVATVQSIGGRGSEAEALVRESVALSALVGDKELEAKVLRLAATVALRNGHAQRARTYAQDAMHLAESLGLYDQAARACTTLLAASSEMPFPTLRSDATRLMNYAERTGERLLKVIALTNLYSLAVTRADDLEVERIGAELAALGPSGDPRLDETYVPASALWMSGHGDFEAALALLQRSLTSELSPARRAGRAAEIALYAAACGKDSIAEQWLKEAHRLLEEVVAEPVTDQALSQLTLALAHAVLGRPGVAQSVLAAAKKRYPWSRLGLVSLVAAVNSYAGSSDSADGLDRLSQSLDQLQRDGLGGFARLIAGLPVCHSRVASRANGLTKMEIRVLRLVAEGASTKSVATELGRSPQTVDTHVKAILRKLDCKSRQRAVSVARNLGIV